MASKATGFKTSEVETQERHVGGSYKSSDGLEGNGDGSGSIEMVGERGINGNGVEVDPEVLEHAIEALEKKKTAWYAYLTTRDFWIVLMIGYVFQSIMKVFSIIMGIQTSPCPLHHSHQHLLLPPR